MDMIIYTDGSSIGNPGPGGWAAIIHDGTQEHTLSGGEAHSTNNRMEMTAVIEALKWLAKGKNALSSRAEIRSDSKLIIESITKGWKRKKNKDLWAELDTVLEKLAARGIEIKWTWVKGHHVDRTNLRCDEIAQRESRQRKKYGAAKTTLF